MLTLTALVELIHFEKCGTQASETFLSSLHLVNAFVLFELQFNAICINLTITESDPLWLRMIISKSLMRSLTTSSRLRHSARRIHFQQVDFVTSRYFLQTVFSVVLPTLGDAV